MFLSLWVFTSCTKPIPPVVEPPSLSVSFPEVTRDSDTPPSVTIAPTLNSINTEWLNHPEWHWIEYDVQVDQHGRQSEWFEDTVTVWSQTPCINKPIQWYNPSTGSTGTILHPLGDVLLTQPYAKHHRGLQLLLSCGDWSSTVQWHKREHKPFPTVESTLTDDELDIQVLHGQYYQLQLEFKKNEIWQTLEPIILTVPLQQIRLNLRNSPTELRWTLAPLNNSNHPTLSDAVAYQTRSESTQMDEVSLHSSQPVIHQGDMLAKVEVTRKQHILTEKRTWIVGTPMNSAPLPSDQIAGTWTKEGLLHNKKMFTLPQWDTTLTLPTEIRMDTQASDARLVQLMPLLYASNNADTLATRLYFTSLYWDALSDRELPWTEALLQQGHQAIQYFDNMTTDMWHQWPYTTQMKVLLAVLASERNGQKVSTKSMHVLLNALCDLPGSDIPEDAALMSHVQWLVRDTSHWRHLACTISNPIPIWSHPDFQDAVAASQQHIQDSIRAWSQPEFPPIDDVHTWWLWNYETEIHKRYTNLNITVTQDGTTQRGLFHEWQFKPLPTSIPPDTNVDLTVSGVGRLYLSEWQFTQGTLQKKEQASLKIHRTIQTTNTSDIDLKHLNLGQELHIEYHIHGKPKSRVCLTEWNSSGLSDISNKEQQCLITDASGNQIVHRTAWVMFDGRFKLPAVFVSNGKTLAHTEDLWLQTTEFTSQSRKSKNMIH